LVAVPGKTRCLCARRGAISVKIRALAGIAGLSPETAGSIRATAFTAANPAAAGGREQAAVPDSYDAGVRVGPDGLEAAGEAVSQFEGHRLARQVAQARRVVTVHLRSRRPALSPSRAHSHCPSMLWLMHASGAGVGWTQGRPSSRDLRNPRGVHKQRQRRHPQKLLQSPRRWLSACSEHLPLPGGSCCEVGPPHHTRRCGRGRCGHCPEEAVRDRRPLAHLVPQQHLVARQLSAMRMGSGMTMNGTRGA
jgi:hypothetical protein